MLIKPPAPFLWALSGQLLPFTPSMSRRGPNQMFGPPQLAPLNVEEQQLYSESLLIG